MAMSIGLWLGVSCTNEELPVEQADNSISFSTEMGGLDTQAITRATGTELSEMGVYAFYTAQNSWSQYTIPGTGANFMNNEKVTKTGNNWTYSPVKYWPNNIGDKLSFIAYSPYNEGTEIANDVLVIPHAVPSDVTNHTDLLWDYQLDKEKKDGTVLFVFKHALARIGFKVQVQLDGEELGEDMEEVEVKVNKIILSKEECTGEETNAADGPFYTNGKLNLPLKNQQATWLEKTGEQGFYLDKDNFIAANNATSTMAQLNKDDSYMLVIPQENVEFNLFVQYEVTVSINSGKTKTYTNNENQPISAQEFLAGKAYSYNLILGLYNMKVASLEIVDFVEGEDYNDGIKVEL